MTEQGQVLSYWQALRDISKIYTDKIDALVQHRGEKGRIVEEITRDALTKVLPQRFSLSTGFLVSSDRKSSGQTDIVIYDHFYNAPLFSEFSVRVFPVEIVYATVEVKSRVDWGKITKALEDIRKIRDLSANKRYVVPEWVRQTDGSETLEPKRKRTRIAPRTYIVAYDSGSLPNNLDDVRSRLAQACADTRAHLHGLCLVDRDVLFWQRIKEKPGDGAPEQQSDNGLPKIECQTNDGYFHFLLSILRHQQNFFMAAADVDPYFDNRASPSSLAALD